MGKEGLGLEITELRLGLPGANSDSGHRCDVMIDKNEKKGLFLRFRRTTWRREIGRKRQSRIKLWGGRRYVRIGKRIVLVIKMGRLKHQRCTLKLAWMELLFFVKLI